VRFADEAMGFVEAALRSVARQIPVGGPDSGKVAAAVQAVVDARDEAMGFTIAHTTSDGTGMPAPGLDPAVAAALAGGAPPDPIRSPFSPPASDLPAAVLTADQQFEADQAAAAVEYDRLLTEARQRLNAAHTAQNTAL